MRRTPVLALTVLLAGCLETMPPIPSVTRVTTTAPGWAFSTGAGDYEVGLTDEHRTDATSLYMRGTLVTTNFAVAAQFVRGEGYRGKRVRWSAWTKHQEVDAEIAGVWMRVDGPTGAQSFDNMQDRPLSGGSDWHQVSVVLDVPDDAIGFSIGMLLHGRGLVLFDDAMLEVVGTEVPTTSSYTMGTPDPTYASKVANSYAGAGDIPQNLGLEIASADPSATTDWVRQHAARLATTDPSQPLDDLAPLTAMVGSAHVVGLGEDTHGTHEFFTLKHRMVKHLVTKMGFNLFAIEATSLEADDVNRYVLGGPGDPKALLSRLYFWTWRTQEVLDLIEWMRAYNATVSFQHSGIRSLEFT